MTAEFAQWLSGRNVDIEHMEPELRAALERKWQAEQPCRLDGGTMIAADPVQAVIDQAAKVGIVLRRASDLIRK